MNPLDDYVSLNQAAAMPGMPSKRTLERMLSRRELPITYLGRKPLLNVVRLREILAEREIKPATGRRR
jgi:hypothetical protein